MVVGIVVSVSIISFHPLNTATISSTDASPEITRSGPTVLPPVVSQVSTFTPVTVSPPVIIGSSTRMLPSSIPLKDPVVSIVSIV